MRRAILVNGVPASGKTTFADRLTRFLIAEGIASAPLGLDTVKEALFAHLGAGDREHNRMLGRASYRAIFDTVARFPDGLVPVIDAWHGFLPVEVVCENVARAGIDEVIEVWCAVAPETAAARYRARGPERHPGHPPASYAEELRALAARATPLSIGTVVRVDCETNVPRATLVAISDLLRDGRAASSEQETT